ncbi:MAG: blue light sensor protein [Methylotenera sp.]|uniref:BLUF domain-containing protein n=1 Tax=Methylotenera sp. TaxID=2051956 RepID=UPI000D474BE6|nr:BLUF domain-containing protein [Methylotenera sp.]MDP3777834.1 BLUF domain-containing protein [Methylotenera sp.]PPC90545.1 MAG: blue light sensor protein [Methylotenera sp.]
MSETNQLILLAYTSVAAHHMTHDELLSLLNSARTCNQRQGITGMLLYMDDCFFQVLEGEEQLVDALYEKICLDERNHHVVKLIREHIAERSFTEWTMSYEHVTRQEMASFTGLTDYLDQNHPGFNGMAAGRARQLIESFKDGQWHRHDLTQQKFIHIGT